MGTPAFMAPEQARARWDLVDARTDLWAVGATMFTLLSGRYVRDGSTANEELGQAMGLAPSLASTGTDLPPEVIALVDRAMAYDLVHRWPSAAEMREAVRALRALPAEGSAREPEALPSPPTESPATPLPLPSTLGTMAPGTLPTVPGPASRRSRWVGAAMASLAAGLGLALWLARPRSPVVVAPPPSAAVLVTSNAVTVPAPALPPAPPVAAPVVSAARPTPVSVADLPDVTPAPASAAPVRRSVSVVAHGSSAPTVVPPHTGAMVSAPSAPVDPFDSRK